MNNIKNNKDFHTIKSFIDGMDWTSARCLPYYDGRFTYGALTGDEGEDMADLCFRDITITIEKVDNKAFVKDTFEVL